MSYDLMFRQALSLHEQGRFDEAENLYRQLLQTAPRNPDILNLLGLIAQAKGIHTEAVELFYKAILQAPNHAPFYFNLALSLDAWGKPYEALDNYQKALKIDNKLKEAWNNIGTIYKNIGQTDHAANAYQQAIALDMTYIEPKANLAQMKNDISALETLTVQYPEDALSFYFMADYCYRQSDYIRAASFCTFAMQKAPFNETIKILSGLINLALDRQTEARLDFEKALILNPLSVSALINLANIETNYGIYDVAEARYKRALEIDQKNVHTHVNYANLLYLQKRLPEALEEYRTAVILNPDLPETGNNLGIILKDIGEYEEALGLFFNAFCRRPQQEEFAINIAETLTLLYRQKPEEAKTIAQKWLAQAPDNPFAQHTFYSLNGEKNHGNNKIHTEKLFDHFADNYELVLKSIGYNVVRDLRQLTGIVKGTIVDLGCGTGLVGETYQALGTKLIGVDLSEKMLEKARGKQLYQELIKSDIFDYLQTKPQADLFIAADVFNYIGNLEAVINAIAPQKLAFSTENFICRPELVCPQQARSLNHQRSTPETSDFILTPSGRYTHNLEYITSLLCSAGYKNIQSQETVLREEDGLPVQGTLWLAT